MEDNKTLTIPYIAYESALASNERKTNKLILIIIILISGLVISNIAWIIAWFQYDYEDLESEEYSVEVDSEGGGIANYIGNDGDINNGKGYGEEEANTSKK